MLQRKGVTSSVFKAHWTKNERKDVYGSDLRFLKFAPSFDNLDPRWNKQQARALERGSEEELCVIIGLDDPGRSLLELSVLQFLLLPFTLTLLQYQLLTSPVWRRLIGEIII